MLAVWLAGAFAPFWFWTVTYARTYATLLPLGTGLAELGRQAGLLASAAPGLWLLAAIGLTAVAWDARVRRRAVFLIPFVLCSFLAVCPGLRFSEHYFVLLLPAAALLAGAAVSALAPTRGSLRARHPGRAAAAAVLVSLMRERDYLFTLPPTAVARAVYGANPFPEAVEIGRWLQTRTAPDDRIAVVGSEPEIYFYARRRAGTSYMYTYPLMEPHPFARQMQEDMIAQLERARPRFLVLVNVDTSWSCRPDSSTRLFDWSHVT